MSQIIIIYLILALSIQLGQSQKIYQESQFFDLYNNQLDQEISTKGILQTNTCPTGTIYYPFVFGGTATDCSQDVVLKGFGVDSSGNSVITGTVDTTSLVTSVCSMYTNGVAGKFSFLAYIDQYGNVKWMNIIANNALMVPGDPQIAGTLTYLGMNYNQKFRISQVQTATGTGALEVSLDKFLPLTTDVLSSLRLEVDASTQDLFVQMQIKTSYFNDASRTVTLIMKLDKTLAIKWWKRVQGLPANENVYAATLTESSKLWSVHLIYTDVSTQKYQIVRIEKSNGDFDNECLFMNSLASTSQVTMEINSDGSLWGLGLQETGSNYFAFATGKTSDNTMSSYYKSTISLKSK
ncbi:UNKNOWN [Stylonychia lemnae]|uniref:Uncharacterized protein n=1 Tax=Stylonychia lemnae TaxID=5949 RepID=A0A077ZMG1_STYLE|nr:UNKNOWN [Stylonychia lemnae]|eukprot:CDW71148.1 UNKNOWN [Stylonychia lemnae]